MRKRIAIGLLALVAVGSAVFFVSQPKKGSVEWHKREYARAERELLADTWKHRFAKAWYKLSGTTYIPYVDMNDPNNPHARSEMHAQALIDLGYWEKRRFDLMNASADEVAKVLRTSMVLSDDDMSQVWVVAAQRSNLWIRTRRVDMPKVAEVIRKADVP